MFKSASKVNGVRAEGGLDNKYISVDKLAGMSETELNNHQNGLWQYEVENEKGETEFLYYPTRIKPEEGKFILFPGSFTHTHRGNQPLSGDKYILTGWVEYL